MRRLVFHPRAALANAALGAAACLATAAPAWAVSADGTWLRSDGMAKVRFEPCGGDTCGTIVWLRHPEGPGKLGERVFFGMKQTAENTWTGMAHNPEDGHDYDGTMVVSGNRLTTKGCALGGAICESQSWSRVR